MEALKVRGRCVFEAILDERAFAPLAEAGAADSAHASGLKARSLMAAQKHTVVAAGVTKQAATAKAKELRAAGKPAYVWPSEVKGKRDVVVMEADEGAAAALDALTEADDFEAGLAVKKKAIRGKLPPGDDWTIVRCWSIHDEDDFDKDDPQYETCANCGKPIAYCVDLTGPEEVTVGTDCAEALTSGATLEAVLKFSADEKRVAREVQKRFKPLLDDNQDPGIERFADAITAQGGDPLAEILARGRGALRPEQWTEVAKALGMADQTFGAGVYRFGQKVERWLISQAAKAHPATVKAILRKIVKHEVGEGAFASVVKEAWAKAMAGHRFEAPKPKVRAPAAVDKSADKLLATLKAMAPTADQMVKLETFLGLAVERWPDMRNEFVSALVSPKYDVTSMIQRLKRIPNEIEPILAGYIYDFLAKNHAEAFERAVRAAVEDGYAGKKKYWAMAGQGSFLSDESSDALREELTTNMARASGRLSDFKFQRDSAVNVRVDSIAVRRGMRPLTELSDLRAHSTGLTRRTADVIGAKLRGVGLLVVVRQSESDPEKFDVLVKRKS